MASHSMFCKDALRLGSIRVPLVKASAAQSSLRKRILGARTFTHGLVGRQIVQNWSEFKSIKAKDMAPFHLASGRGAPEG